ncbi:hypothetical protein SteCoe_30330 [Stentor coeruleus]|uniref:Uncharacterized protein n=1 Tax=Stentor coeruleus TaxID=5963 RepID=A0A1R2B3S8_9CILI|nr:hypothetical protein SteCoe_30330 [Stentor coeruleus]
MGCGNSKEAAIKELNQIVSQMRSEIHDLEYEREQLKCNKEENTLEEKNTLKDIKLMHKEFEKELKSLSGIVKLLYESSKVNSQTRGTILQELLEMKEKIERKVQRTKDLIKEREKLKEQETNLEMQLANTEKKIHELEANFFPNDQVRQQYYTAHKQLSELESQKEDLFEEIEKAQEVLNALNDEIKESGYEDRSKATDPSSYEFLLSLTDTEVNDETRKVDKELEELAEQIKTLKNKEGELQNIDILTGQRSQSRTFVRNESLKTQLKSSQERVELLESEKQRVKDEIVKLKRNTCNEEGLSEKLNALNDIIDKKKNKDDETGRAISENLVSDIEETLKRAKMLTSNMIIRDQAFD